MTEALREVLNFAFNKLRLRRINISAFPRNNGSNGLIKKMDFKFEGKRRKNIRSKATKKIHDENIYGLLKEEWRKHKKWKPLSLIQAHW